MTRDLNLQAAGGNEADESGAETIAGAGRIDGGDLMGRKRQR